MCIIIIIIIVVVVAFVVVIAGDGCKKCMLLQNANQWENQVYATQFHDMHTFLQHVPL